MLINILILFKGGLKITPKYSKVLFDDGVTSGFFTREEYLSIAKRKSGPQEHVSNYGDGAFEGIRAFYNQERQDIGIFALDAHIDRLFKSIGYLGFTKPEGQKRINKEAFFKKYGITLGDFDTSRLKYFERDKEWVKQKIIELVAISAKEGVFDIRHGCYIRPKLYRGMEVLPSGEVSAAAGVFSLYHNVVFEAFVHHWGAYVKEPKVRVFEEGNSNLERKHKLISNYCFGSRAKNKSRENGFDEALIVDETLQRNVLEGGGENIVVKFDGFLYTPNHRGKAILDGITLQLGTKIAESLDIRICNREDIPLERLLKSAKAAMFYGTATGNELIHSVYDPVTDKRVLLDLKDEMLVELKERYEKITTGTTRDKDDLAIREEYFTWVPLEEKVLA